MKYSSKATIRDKANAAVARAYRQASIGATVALLVAGTSFAQEVCPSGADCSTERPVAEQPAQPDLPQTDDQAAGSSGEAQAQSEQMAPPEPEPKQETSPAAGNSDPAKAATQTEAPSPSAGDGVPRVALISVGIAVVALGLIFVIGTAVVRFSTRTYEKYGYRVARNWINVLWPLAAVIAYIGHAAAQQGDSGTADTANLIAVGLIALVLIQNVRKTGLITGIIATIVQSLLLVFSIVIVLLYGFFRGERRRETAS